MASLIERLRKIMGQPPTPGKSVAVPLDDESIERLMRLLCETRDDELSCEEVYGRLDEYVDCLMSREDVGSIRPLLEHHLGICPDCRDELNALVHALENAAADNELN
jgi:hypothetical protein